MDIEWLCGAGGIAFFVVLGLLIAGVERSKRADARRRIDKRRQEIAAMREAGISHAERREWMRKFGDAQRRQEEPQGHGYGGIGDGPTGPGEDDIASRLQIELRRRDLERRRKRSGR